MKSITPWLVTFKNNPNARIRLFCLHYAGGGAALYRNWIKSLSDDIELIAVQLPGREARFSEKPYTRMDALVADLLQDIKHYMDKPYIVFGHSLGALIAFELLRGIRKHGFRVPLLFMPSGHHAPQLPDRKPPTYDAPDEVFKDRLRNYNGTPSEILQNEDYMKAILPMLRADFEILGTYRYSNGTPLECPITAFDGVDDDHVNEEELLGWKKQTVGRFKYYRLPGDHFFIKSAESQVIDAINNEVVNILDADYTCERLTL